MSSNELNNTPLTLDIIPPLMDQGGQRSKKLTRIKRNSIYSFFPSNNIPLGFWFTNNVNFAMPYMIAGKIYKRTAELEYDERKEYKAENFFRICACSGKYEENIFKGKCPTNFLKSLIDAIDFNARYTNGLDYFYQLKNKLLPDSDVLEVQYCLDFLAIQKVYNDKVYNENLNRDNHQNLSLWDFIVNFLGIEKDSFYDYILMNYLGNMKYTDHGSGIRCSWLNDEYKHVINPDREKKILEWIKNPDTEIDKPWLI